MDRLRPLLVALALAVALIAGAAPRLPGDGGEYLALSLNFSRFHGPSIAPSDIQPLMQEMSAWEPGLADFDPKGFMRQARDRSLDFLHFWFYSLLATPGVWLTQLAGAPAPYAFALLNVALLLLALRVALPRLGAAACVLLFASPILWWIDKPHTEPYTFALLVVALVCLKDRPWISLLAAGAAAAQTPPMVPFLGLVALAGLARGRAIVTDRRWLAGLAIGGLLALLQPLYFYLRYGTPYILVNVTNPGTPSLAEIAAPLVDPNIGLLPNFPALLVVVVAAAVVVLRRRPRDLVAPEVLVAAASAVVFLLIVARNNNPHHGGTPSLSRYGLWLIPLSIPLLRSAAEIAGAWWTRALWGVAAASAVVCAFAFHPAVPQNSREPTWLATYLWQHHPGWYNPLPQVFIEIHTRGEQALVPVATADCRKVLVGGERTIGAWPIPCYPAPIPDACRGAYCYGNQHGREYVFTPPPGRDRGPGTLFPAGAWPPGSEPHVRALFDHWGWPALVINGDDGGMLRRAQNVRVTSLTGESGVIYILRSAKPGASVFLRPARGMTGMLIDPRSGTTIRDLGAGGEGGPWDVAIPEGIDPLLLAVKR